MNSTAQPLIFTIPMSEVGWRGSCFAARLKAKIPGIATSCLWTKDPAAAAMAYAPQETRGANPDPKPAESLLLDKLDRLTGNLTGRGAVRFNLSQLKPHYRKPAYLRLAARVLDPLVKTGNAETHTLSHGDLVLLTKDLGVSDVDSVAERVRNLFDGDPLTDRKSGRDRFTTWYDLERDARLFRQDLGDGAAAPPKPSRPPLPPIHPRELDAAIKALEGLSMRDFLRQQPALRMGSKGLGKLLFREQYVAISDLGKRLAPGLDLLGNRWLFQHLTETIDRKILDTIGNRRFGALRNPISINLNIDTILSSHFREFQETAAEAASLVAVEIHIVDAIANTHLYDRARRRLQRFAFPVVIDGLDPLLLAHCDPSFFEAEYYKVHWGEEYRDRVAGPCQQMAKEQVSRLGRDRVIMSRVDSEDAVMFGLQLGISAFQGYFVDRLMQAVAAKMARDANPGGPSA
ncbi:MAG: hypothetical protein ACPGO3_14000 [Magnetospiraceae bacterium]